VRAKRKGKYAAQSGPVEPLEALLGLPVRRARFASEYLIDCNGTKARNGRATT
jgi:hypothetical protein